MYELGSHRSTIREIFEYGNQRAAIVGRENVLDFSLGNPNVPAPDAVREAILAEAAGDRSRSTATPLRRAHRTFARRLRTTSTAVSARITPATAFT